MSLILQALKRAREITERKAPPIQGPAALQSFGFGRAPKTVRWKQVMTAYVLPATMLGLLLAYTVNFWINRLSTPGADAEVSFTETQEPSASPTEENTPRVSETSPAAISAETGIPSQVIPERTPPAPAAENRVPLPAPPVEMPRPAVTGRAPIERTSPPAVATLPGAPAPPPETSAAPASNTLREETARDPFELALFYQRTGDYPKAFDYYNRVLAADPLNAPVFNNIGLLHLAMSRNADAIRAFRNAIAVDPNYAMAHNNLGIALMNDNQDSEATRELERALQLNPQNAEALTNLGILARREGQAEEAKFYYLRALQVNPGHAETHYNLAMILDEQGESGSAVEHFEAFLKFGSHTRPELTMPVEGKIQELRRRMP
jgi:Tfp pilus assembly protein PilF